MFLLFGLCLCWIVCYGLNLHIFCDFVFVVRDIVWGLVGVRVVVFWLGYLFGWCSWLIYYFDGLFGWFG